MTTAEARRTLAVLTPTACAWFPSLWRQRDAALRQVALSTPAKRRGW